MVEIMAGIYWSGYFVSLLFLIVLMGWALANIEDLDIDIFTSMLIVIILPVFSWIFIMIIIAGLIFKYIKDRK